MRKNKIKGIVLSVAHVLSLNLLPSVFLRALFSTSIKSFFEEKAFLYHHLLITRGFVKLK